MGVKGVPYGIVVEVDTAGGTTFVPIGQVREVTFPGEQQSTVDGTTHDSPGGFEEPVVVPVIRSETVELLVAYDPAEVSHQSLRAAVLNPDKSIIPNMRITLPPTFSNYTLTFNAIILSFNVATPMEELMTATIMYHPVGPRVES